MRADVHDVLTGSRRINLKWRELEVDYAWLPPFHGIAATRPNRIEAVFSGHKGVAIEHAGKVYDITVHPGGTYAVGADGTRLLRVHEYSDTLEMYPSDGLLKAVAVERGLQEFAIEPTLQGAEPKLFTRDALFLAPAHLLRRAMHGTTRDFRHCNIDTGAPTCLAHHRHAKWNTPAERFQAVRAESLNALACVRAHRIKADRRPLARRTCCLRPLKPLGISRGSSKHRPASLPTNMCCVGAWSWLSDCC